MSDYHQYSKWHLSFDIFDLTNTVQIINYKLSKYSLVFINSRNYTYLIIFSTEEVTIIE